MTRRQQTRASVLSDLGDEDLDELPPELVVSELRDREFAWRLSNDERQRWMEIDERYDAWVKEQGT